MIECHIIAIEKGIVCCFAVDGIAICRRNFRVGIDGLCRWGAFQRIVGHRRQCLRPDRLGVKVIEEIVLITCRRICRVVISQYGGLDDIIGGS